MKIRTRLTIQFTTIFAFILLLFCLTVYFYTGLTRRNAFYQELANRANIVAHVFLDADQVSKATYRRTLRKFYQTLPREIVQVYDWSGKMVFREGEGRLRLPESRLQRIRLLAAMMAAAAVLYFGALWAAGLKLRQLLRR